MDSRDVREESRCVVSSQADGKERSQDLEGERIGYMSEGFERQVKEKGSDMVIIKGSKSCRQPLREPRHSFTGKEKADEFCPSVILSLENDWG